MIRRLLLWLFPPLLDVLISKASKLGTITFTQVSLAGGLGWFCSLRAHSNSHRGQRYCWTGDGETMAAAIEQALDNADEYKIGARAMMPHDPKLGGSDNDG